MGEIDLGSYARAAFHEALVRLASLLGWFHPQKDAPSREAVQLCRLSFSRMDVAQRRVSRKVREHVIVLLNCIVFLYSEASK